MKFKLIVLALIFLISGCTSSKKTSTAGGKQDGLSYETAIVVKSVSEEYAYVKKVCPECKMKKQSLRSQGKKYYDLLFFDDAGKEVIYYFDINSFYGKMF